MVSSSAVATPVHTSFPAAVTAPCAANVIPAGRLKCSISASSGAQRKQLGGRPPAAYPPPAASRPATGLCGDGWPDGHRCGQTALQLAILRRQNQIYKNLYEYVNINKSGLNFKGIVSRNKYFFNACNNQKVLSIHVLIVFRLFCFLVKGTQE
jgi:hypothetical protein